MNTKEINQNNRWRPFKTALKADYARPIESVGGVEDRLRIVAFAEFQARETFNYGAQYWAQKIPQEWQETWRSFAEVEDRHGRILLERMQDLGFDPGARKVSDKLSHLCRAAPDVDLFLFLLASAEERGMESGFILAKQMEPIDATSAKLFLTIAQEEEEHVAFSKKVFASKDLVLLKQRAISLDKEITQKYDQSNAANT